MLCLGDSHGQRIKFSQAGSSYSRLASTFMIAVQIGPSLSSEQSIGVIDGTAVQFLPTVRPDV